MSVFLDLDAGDFLFTDNGILGDATSVLRDGTGGMLTFVHPGDITVVTAAGSPANITFDFRDSLGAGIFIVGSLTDPNLTPNALTVRNLVSTVVVGLSANASITEGGSDTAVDISAGTLLLRAGTGIGTAANALEIRAPIVEAHTDGGDINLRAFGNVQIGGASDALSGLSITDVGTINFTALGSITLSDASGNEAVHGGNVAGSNVSLTALGLDSDIVANVDHRSIGAEAGNIVLTAGRDIAFGTLGDFDNDVRASGSITVNAGRDFIIAGGANIASDDFGQESAGNLVINAGRNIHVTSVTGASLFAGGNDSADLILTTGAGGAVMVDGVSQVAVESLSGDVIVNTDRILIDAAAGITAGNSNITLRPVTEGLDIDLGSAADTAQALEISDAELNRLFTPSLTIGSATAGNITVSSGISPDNAANMTLLTGADINLLGGITVAGNLVLGAGGDVVAFAGSSIAAGTLVVFADAFQDDDGVGGFVDLSNLAIATDFPITINGNLDADTLTGTTRGDTINGAAGHDIISGGAGNDLINAGFGNDRVDAGANDDTVTDDGFNVPGDIDFYDGGDGTDNVVYSQDWRDAMVIDLANGQTRWIGVVEDTFANFENASVGGAGQVIGDGGVNVITGVSNSGNPLFEGNIFRGGGGGDTLDGGGGADSLFGEADGDTLIGGTGSDNLYGGAGADQHIGGEDAGIDLARYDDANYGNLTIRLDNSTLNAGAAAIGDTYIGIEGLVGGAGLDTLVGDGLANTLLGLGGNDTLRGGIGTDTLDGGGGASDIADYSDKTLAVSVTLTGAVPTWVQVNGVNEDSILNIEAVIGGAGNDTLIGDGIANTLAGGLGNDLLRGGLGADALNGGGGIGDAADYSDKTQAVTVTLTGAVPTWVKVNGVDEDLIVNIENIIGGSVGDTLVGDGLGNTLVGLGGADTLGGGLGNDTLKGGLGADALNGGGGTGDIADYSDKTQAVTATLTGGTPTWVKVNGVNEDLIVNIEGITGGTGNDTLVGDSIANTLSGGGGNDLLRGGLGADALNGGAGTGDAADYSDKAQAVTVTLTGAVPTWVKVNGVDEDLIVNIENIIGGSVGDALTGDGLGNTLVGLGGGDTLSGLGGSDTLLGGLGNDTLTGGAAADIFAFNTAPGAGNIDNITDFAADDFIQLENAIFTAFATAGTMSAIDFNDHIVYNAGTGALSYDSNGVGVGGGLNQFAILSLGLTLNNADFLIV